MKHYLYDVKGDTFAAICGDTWLRSDTSVTYTIVVERVGCPRCKTDLAEAARKLKEYTG